MQNLGQNAPPLSSYINMSQRPMAPSMSSGMMGPPAFPPQGMASQYGMPPAAMQYQLQQGGLSQQQQQQQQMLMHMQQQQQQQQQNLQQQHQQIPQMSQQQQMAAMLLQQRQMLQHQQQQQQHQQMQAQQGGMQPQHMLAQMQQTMPQHMQAMHQQMPMQSNMASPSMKKKPKPAPPRPSQMAPPPPVVMRTPMHVPAGPQPGENEPYADEFDSKLPQDLAIARFEMRHNALNEIFSPESLAQLPEYDEEWKGKDPDDLEAEIVAMEKANEELQKRAETGEDDLRARFERAGRGEISPSPSPSPRSPSEER